MKKNIKKLLPLLLIIATIVVSYASTASAFAIVNINYFVASAYQSNSGQPVTLSWDVLFTSYVEITSDSGEYYNNLAPRGSLQVRPNRNTTYQIRARGLLGIINADRRLTISVGSNYPNNSNNNPWPNNNNPWPNNNNNPGNNQNTMPAIKYFHPSAANVKEGQTVTLYWETQNVSRVEIIGLEAKNNENVLNTSGSLEVWPTKTTTYELRAYNFNSTIVSASTTVTVSPANNNNSNTNNTNTNTNTDNTY